MKWTRHSSNKLFEHPRLTLYEDNVELPNGLKTTYLHFGDMPDAAMVLAQNNQGDFLVQKEYSYPPDENLYQLPGGALNPGEDPIVGAAREFAEEAGLKGDLEQLGWFYLNNRRSKQKMFVYLAKDLLPAEAAKDPEEDFEDFWFSELQIDDMIRTNEIVTYTALAGWALYKSKQ